MKLKDLDKKVKDKAKLNRMKGIMVEDSIKQLPDGQWSILAQTELRSLRALPPMELIHKSIDSLIDDMETIYNIHKQKMDEVREREENAKV